MIEKKQNLTKADFELTMETAIESNSQYVVLLIKLPDLLAPEAIINSRANFELKYQYINDTYDEHMNHKHAPGVSIVGFVICNSAIEVAATIVSYMHGVDNIVH